MKIHGSMILISALLSILTLFSCSKDPEVIIETVTETVTVVDTLYLTDTVTVIETLIQEVHDTNTSFILVRHAETTGIGSDPALSPAGVERANALARALNNVTLSAVYSTNFKRTQQTAEAVAADQTLLIDPYDPFDLDPFVDGVLKDFEGEVILVVGHSNTTPALLNVLTGTNNYQNLPETEYDNMYLVTLAEKGRATVIHLKYGD